MYANIKDILRAATSIAWKPRSKPPVDLWCDEHRMLSTSGKSSSRGGRWNTDRTPYLRAILRATISPEVREISFQKSTQIGATELLFCYVLYAIAVLKKSLLYVYPTRDKGKEVNQDRLVPALLNCKPTAGLMSMAGKKAITERKVRIGGSIIQFAYTKSADSMRGDPFGVVLNDEVDVFDYSREDPIENGRSRQTTFDDSLMINVSSPMDDQTGITAMYDKSHVRWTYHTPCTQCGSFFELWDFSLLKWIGGMQVSGAVAAANCWIQCPCCSERINLDDHQWMMQHGLWITQSETIESDGTILDTLDPDTRQLTTDTIKEATMLSRIDSERFRAAEHDEHDDGQATVVSDGLSEESQRYGIRIVGQRDRGERHGYRICTMQSLVSAKGIRGLVADFVEAKGHPDPTWWRDRMGRSPNTKGERVEITDIKLLCKGPQDQGHYFRECPAWTVVLFGGIDCQKDCVKIMVYAFGPEGKRRALVDSREIPRDEAAKFYDVKQAMADLGDYPVRGCRRKLTPSFFIDSGHWTHQVYEVTRELQAEEGRERFILCKGDSHKNSFKPYRRTGISEVRSPSGEKYTLPNEIELVLVNGDYYKDLRMQRLAPLSDEVIERVCAAHDTQADRERALAAIQPLEFPAYESWEDADSVISELAAEEKVWVGAGSGRSGKDGLGRARREWRKRSSHAKNDYGDATDYAMCAADRYGIHRWTAEMAYAHIGKLERELGNNDFEYGVDADQGGLDRAGQADSRRLDTTRSRAAGSVGSVGSSGSLHDRASGHLEI